MATANPGVGQDTDFESLLFSRRFAAVALVHPQINNASDVERLIKALPDGAIRQNREQGVWRLWRTAFSSPTNYFTGADYLALPGGGSYFQELYVAAREVSQPSLSGFVVLLISPYVRLLNRHLTATAKFLGQPRVAFAVPDMKDLFEYFEPTRYTWMDATRVSVKDDSEPSLDTVSLSGRNPLNSNLRRDLMEVGSAYSIRLEVRRADRPLNLYLDRFGNFWWYQRSAQDLVAPLDGLGEILEHARIGVSTVRPTSRVVPERDAG